jgi:hypothetical protein
MGRGFSRSLARAAMRNAGIPGNVAGLSVETTGQGAFTTTFTFNAMRLTVTDALAYASQKIFDFADGKIRIKGGTAKLQFAVLTDRTATINPSASMTWALGSAAASSITLASTMVDVLAKTTRTLDGTLTALSTASAADIVAAATLDGTVTAKDLFLNVGFETNTEIDADGIIAVTGKIVLHWENWGDNA